MNGKNIDGLPIKIEYSENLTSGIYVTADKKQIEKNCENLKISLEQTTSSGKIKESNFEGMRIITKYKPGKYLQYLILDSATKQEVDLLINAAYEGNPSALSQQHNLLGSLNEMFQRDKNP